MKEIRRTLQFLVELVERDDDAFDMFAFVEVLLGFFVAFFEVDFDGNHLCDLTEAREKTEGLAGCDSTEKSISTRKVTAEIVRWRVRWETYLHVRIGQPRIRYDRRAAIKYLHCRVGHSRLRAQQRTNPTHLALVACLLLEFADSGLFGRLALVDQTGGKFDADGIDGRSILYERVRFALVG
jgi:hypothetical protein